jgi:hypothetical protein
MEHCCIAYQQEGLKALNDWNVEAILIAKMWTVSRQKLNCALRQESAVWNDLEEG